jgi:hypothetical protein
MADVFTNDLRIREQESGSNAGTWGGLLNTTIRNIASAFGQGSEAIPDASTHTITLADGVADEARSMYLKCTGGGQACTVTLAPNTISKVWIISNETSFTLTFSQGSGSNVAVAAGSTKMIVTDGAGASGAVTDALSGLEGSLSTLAVTGALTVDTTTLVVDATNNNVGIGVTPEAYTVFNPVLRIKNTNTGGGGTLAGTSADNFRMFANTFYDGAYKRLATGFATQYGQESGSHVWSYAASGAADSTFTWSEVMRTSGSNFGIGVSSPQRVLTLGKGDSSGVQTQYTNSTTGTGLGDGFTVGIDGSENAEFWNYSNTNMLFATNSTQRMILSSSGEFTLGNPSAGSALQLDVSATGSDGVDIKGTYYTGSYGPMKFHTGGTESMILTSEGSVGINTNSIHDFGANNHELQINGVKGGSVAFSRGTNGATEQFALRTSDDDALRFEYGSNYASEAMRLTSVGDVIVGTSNVAPVSNNVQGVSIRSFGELQSSRDGGATLYLNRKTNDGEIVILRQDGADIGNISSRSGVHIQIQSAGNTAGLHFGGSEINPVKNQAISDNTIDLGQASYRFDDIFATNGTIQTSDANEKQDIEALSAAEQRVAVTAKGLIRKYRWKSSVAEKAEDSRIHVGIIAQDLQACFAAEGLDAARYAMFCSDTWTNDDGSEQTRLGVRYSELLAFIIAAI